MATGGDRAGPEHSSRDDTTPAPAPDPQAGSPSCCAGLAPFGVASSSSPSPRPPNNWDPGLAGDSGSSCRSGGAAMTGYAPGWATVAWQGPGAVARDADAPCCCPYRDSGLQESLRATVAAFSATQAETLLLFWALRLLLLPLLFLRGPGAAAACAPPLLQRQLAVPALLRYSQACYYAGENGLLGPSPP